MDRREAESGEERVLRQIVCRYVTSEDPHIRSNDPTEGGTGAAPHTVRSLQKPDVPRYLEPFIGRALPAAMSLAKVKVEKTDLEAASARSRLDAVLKGLLDRSEVDREQMEDESGKASADSQCKDSSPSAAGKRPSVRPSHHRRKKRKEEDGVPEAALPKTNTFVIRLFDRSVDLAQFSEETTLYPVCRAWLRNSPGAKAPEPPPTPPPSEEGDVVNGSSQNIYHLPSPSPCPITEAGEPVNLRIPSPLPREEEPLNIDMPPETTPSMSTLIYQNMNRWKKIRQRWKDASYRNQQRYAQSMKILKEMYERQ